MLHFFPHCHHQAFSFSVRSVHIQAQFAHIRGDHRRLGVQAGVYILRCYNCYCYVSIPAINIRTTATAAETMIPETLWWLWSWGEYWVSTRHGCYGWCRLPFSAGAYNGNRIKG
jgi:hypothetical protein